jgi:hypothetical protein
VACGLLERSRFAVFEVAGAPTEKWPSPDRKIEERLSAMFRRIDYHSTGLIDGG